VSLSTPAVAELISSRFEPAWQSVRDVPQVTIDFGEGHVVRRTLHGNIATYVCAPDGATIDVIPGLYDAATYKARLDEALALVETHEQWPAEQRAEMLRTYHARAELRRQTASLGIASVSKSGIERPTERVIVPRAAEPVPAVELTDSKKFIELPTERTLRPSQTKDRVEAPVVRIAVAADGTRVNLDLLARDTEHNEAVRRPLISAMLAEEGRHTPESLTRRIYRDVLDADLDDPYLGLGDALFETYPFLR